MCVRRCLTGISECISSLSRRQSLEVNRRFCFFSICRHNSRTRWRAEQTMPVSKYEYHVYAGLFVLVSGLPAYADNEDVIARCARIASVGDRILCLEDALRQSSSELAQSQPEPKTPPAPAGQAATPAPYEDPLPGSTPEPRRQSTGDPVTTKESFGLKADRPAKDTNAIRVTVVSMRKNLGNKFVFETGDGQVWLQTDQRTIRYGDVPFEAEIRPASMGSFFLKPDAGGVSVRVRREK